MTTHLADTIRGVDPRTGDLTGWTITEDSPASVGAVCQAAAAAAPALGAVSRATRAGWLRALAGALDARRDELVPIADRESGLGRPRLDGELTRTCFQLSLFAEVLEEGSYLEATIDHAGPTAMGPRPDLRRMLVPLGPVAVFAASNFPFAFSVAGGDTAAALAAGCPVVVKAHPSHPQLSDLVADTLRAALDAAGAPAATLSVVHGVAAGQALVTDPRIRAVGFTGSAAGGRALADLAAARPDPIPFYGELSGINPLVVTPEAAAERAADIGTGIADSVNLGGGQFCTKPGIALVPIGTAGDTLLDALVALVRRRESAIGLNAAIAAGYAAGIEQSRGGAAVVAQGRPAEAGAGGFHMRPTVLEVGPDDVRGRLLDEVFGPSIVVVRYDPAHAVEAIDAVLDRLPAALTASVHAAAADTLAGHLAVTLAARAGRVVWNGYPTGVAVAWAMQHGGPAPSTTNALHTSVGPTAIRRFLRPVTWQDTPQAVLAPELRDDWGSGRPDAVAAVPRRVDGSLVLP